jgi:hypothetical protein
MIYENVAGLDSPRPWLFRTETSEKQSEHSSEGHPSVTLLMTRCVTLHQRMHQTGEEFSASVYALPRLAAP